MYCTYSSCTRIHPNRSDMASHSTWLHAYTGHQEIDAGMEPGGARFVVQARIRYEFNLPLDFTFSAPCLGAHYMLRQDLSAMPWCTLYVEARSQRHALVHTILF